MIFAFGPTGEFKREAPRISGTPHPASTSSGPTQIDLAELVNEPWILAPPNNVARTLLENAFRAEGLEPPRSRFTTYSTQLRMQLLSSGQYLTLFTDSTVRYSADRWSLRVLPILLGPPRLPVVLVTLKHRTLTPSVQLFSDQALAMTKAMHAHDKASYPERAIHAEVNPSQEAALSLLALSDRGL